MRYGNIKRVVANRNRENDMRTIMRKFNWVNCAGKGMQWLTLHDAASWTGMKFDLYFLSLMTELVSNGKLQIYHILGQRPGQYVYMMSDYQSVGGRWQRPRNKMAW